MLYTKCPGQRKWWVNICRRKYLEKRKEGGTEKEKEGRWTMEEKEGKRNKARVIRDRNGTWRCGWASGRQWAIVSTEITAHILFASTLFYYLQDAFCSFLAILFSGGVIVVVVMEPQPHLFFALVIFPVGAHIFAKGQSQTVILHPCLPSNWDHRHEPSCLVISILFLEEEMVISLWNHQTAKSSLTKLSELTHLQMLSVSWSQGYLRDLVSPWSLTWPLWHSDKPDPLLISSGGFHPGLGDLFPSYFLCTYPA